MSFIRLDDIVGEKNQARFQACDPFLQVWSCFCCLQADCKLKTIVAMFDWVEPKPLQLSSAFPSGLGKESWSSLPASPHAKAPYHFPH